jgi:hypothetical protein
MSAPPLVKRKYSHCYGLPRPFLLNSNDIPSASTKVCADFLLTSFSSIKWLSFVWFCYFTLRVSVGGGSFSANPAIYKMELPGKLLVLFCCNVTMGKIWHVLVVASSWILSPCERETTEFARCWVQLCGASRTARLQPMESLWERKPD